MPVPNERLRVGRDPNDTSWVVVRYPADFASAQTEGLEVNAGRNDSGGSVLELAPAGRGIGVADEWLPESTVTTPHGTEFTASGNWILVQKKCDAQPRRLLGVGGHGAGSGHFDRIVGLAMHRHGYLLVADSQNHRVVVLGLSAEEDQAEIVATLGMVDAWGQPVAGDEDGAMTEPVHVAVSPCGTWIYVADREAGRVHIFDGRFSFVRSFAPFAIGGRTDGVTPRPAAIAIGSDGTIWVVDLTWPRLLPFSPTGDPILPGIPPDTFSSLKLHPRYQASGQAVFGPLDSGRYNADWHRLSVGLDLPAGTQVSLQSFASNDKLAPIASMPWGPSEAIPIRSEDPSNVDQEYSRLVLSDSKRWHQERKSGHRRAFPLLARYTGAGPISATTTTLPAEAMPVLRLGDTLRFSMGTVTHDATLTALPSVDVTLTALAGVRKVYGPGTRLKMLERGGALVPVASRSLYEQLAAEVVDLSTAPGDDRSVTVSCPHHVAAFLQAGDLIELEEAGDSIHISIDAVHFAEASVDYTPVLPGDFSTSALHLHVTPGRLVIEDFESFENFIAAQMPLTVRNQAAQEDSVQAFWADTRTRTIWLTTGTLGPNVDFENWFEFDVASHATDRGQFLWVRIVLEGARDAASLERAQATPTLRWLRALWPRPSLLSLLPRVYGRRDPRKDPVGALFLERFLTLFEGQMTRAEEAYESVSRLLNPEAANEEWLGFVGSWLGLVFDPSWPIERRRALVLEADSLYRRRGTLWALQRYIEIYHGQRPEILEGFAVAPVQPFVLGCAGTVGCSTLGAQVGEANHRAGYAHLFTVFVDLQDPCNALATEATLRSIIDSVKPAHTDYKLCLRDTAFALGKTSRVGLDTAVGSSSQPTPLRLGQSITLNTASLLHGNTRPEPLLHPTLPLTNGLTLR